MDEIYIKTSNLSQWLVEKQFKNKDLISLKDLIAKIEDLSDDLENKTEQYEKLLQNVEDNYKFIGQAEQIDYSDQW